MKIYCKLYFCCTICYKNLRHILNELKFNNTMSNAFKKEKCFYRTIETTILELIKLNEKRRRKKGIVTYCLNNKKKRKIGKKVRNTNKSIYTRFRD